MLNMRDDGSRVFGGSKIYSRELRLSYLDFLPAAFLSYGRPRQIYVDYHAMFFAQNPDALTQLGWALKFCDSSFLYAPTPQAKGKSEREHQFWQGRLPGSELLTRRTDSGEAWNLPDTTFGPVALKSPVFRLEMLVGWYQEWPRSIPSAQEF